MWTTITREDLQRAKAKLTHDYFEMDLRHAEEREALVQRHTQERNALEARLANIQQIEGKIEAFVRQYLPVSDAKERKSANLTPAQPIAPTEVEVVATWAKTKFGFRAA